MGSTVHILGIRHRDNVQLEKVLTYIHGESKKESLLFLLEYDEARFKEDSDALTKGSTQCHEFHSIVNNLKSLNVQYWFIDRNAIQRKEAAVNTLGLRELVRLALHRRKGKGLEQLSNISPSLYEELILKREEDMAQEIIRAAQKGEFAHITVIVGKDHVHRIAKIIQGEVSHVKTDTL